MLRSCAAPEKGRRIVTGVWFVLFRCRCRPVVQSLGIKSAAVLRQSQTGE